MKGAIAMLANGAILEYKKGTAWTELEGLKEIPDIGVEPEKVENTTLKDKVKKYEQGVGDAGDMEYKFRYENETATSTYRVLRKLQEEGATVSFRETLVDGTTFEFAAQPSVKLTGGGVNGVIDCSCSLALQSDIEITDPGTP